MMYCGMQMFYGLEVVLKFRKGHSGKVQIYFSISLLAEINIAVSFVRILAIHLWVQAIKPLFETYW